FFADHHTAGLWFWEVEEFPERYRTSFDFVDEVWVASEFAERTLAAVSPKPVTKILLPIVAPPRSATATRRSLGLPDGFVLLYMFDFMSVVERKNPMGLIEAFTRAFPPGDGPHLMIKTINGDRQLAELERLRLAAAERPDILVVDGYLSADERGSLMSMADC